MENFKSSLCQQKKKPFFLGKTFDERCRLCVSLELYLKKRNLKIAKKKIVSVIDILLYDAACRYEMYSIRSR